MRTTWTEWAPGDMRAAAEMEGRVSLTALEVPEHPASLGVLPYFNAFADYAAHVTRCADCRRDDRDDCFTGQSLCVVARVGIEEQQRMAAQN